MNATTSPLRRALTRITATMLFAALALPPPVTAQHIRYEPIDVGTLGGPTTYESVNGPGTQILNNAGIVSSSSDTSTPDPNNLCFNPDCFLTHAFRWKNGVLTDLGALSGVNSSAAGAINARGWSVGQSQNGLTLPSGLPEIQAVLWRDSQAVELGTLGGRGSLALYVNEGGQVVGAAANAVPDSFALFGDIFGSTQTRAFLWEKGVMRDLGTLGGPDAIGSFGGCVNERMGLVAGSSYTNFTPNPSTQVPTLEPFLWENGEMTDLGTLGGVYGIAQCANNRGQVIGQSSLAENPGACLTGQPGCHAFFWDRGTLTDLGTLGGTFSIPIWLNNAGEAVGGATTPDDEFVHATLWRNRVITDLGALPGDCFSVAEAINSRGQIVGTSFNCESNISRAVLWDENSIIDLNTLVPANSTLQLVDAVNMNDRGEILALGLPPGVQSGDFGGHLALLIPCGNDNQGWKVNADTTAAATQGNPAVFAKTRATRMLGRPTPTQILATWRARLAQRHHIPGRGASKD